METKPSFTDFIELNIKIQNWQKNIIRAFEEFKKATIPVVVVFQRFARTWMMMDGKHPSESVSEYIERMGKKERARERYQRRYSRRRK